MTAAKADADLATRKTAGSDVLPVVGPAASRRSFQGIDAC
jgi:hypothetical protein